MRELKEEVARLKDLLYAQGLGDIIESESQFYSIINISKIVNNVLFMQVSHIHVTNLKNLEYIGILGILGLGCTLF